MGAALPSFPTLFPVAEKLAREEGRWWPEGLDRPESLEVRRSPRSPSEEFYGWCGFRASSRNGRSITSAEWQGKETCVTFRRNMSGAACWVQHGGRDPTDATCRAQHEGSDITGLAKKGAA